MKVIFRRSFAKDVKKIRSKALRQDVQDVIEQLEQRTSLQDIPNVALDERGILLPYSDW